MKQTYKKWALTFSAALIIIWSILGTGTSLAWFTDTDEEVKNIIHFAEFDLEVSHRLEDGTWELVEQDTAIFDDEALYEPGYVQTVYLKVENKGSVPFDLKTAVSVTDYTLAINVFGQPFSLQDYLKFGLAAADEEQEILDMTASRTLSEEIANMPLGNYASEEVSLGAGETMYVALIVRMPKEVGNVANYRGDVIPRVNLGVIVSATQQKN